MASAQTSAQTEHGALAADALVHVRAASAADAALARIAAGTARPDELGDEMLLELAALPEPSRSAAVRGYLRCVQKRVEALQETQVCAPGLSGAVD